MFDFNIIFGEIVMTESEREMTHLKLQEEIRDLWKEIRELLEQTK